MIDYGKIYNEIIKQLAEDGMKFTNLSKIYGNIKELQQHLKGLEIEKNYEEINKFVNGEITISSELGHALNCMCFSSAVSSAVYYTGKVDFYFHEINRLLFDYFSLYEKNVQVFGKKYRKNIKWFFYHSFRLEIDELCNGHPSGRSPYLDEFLIPLVLKHSKEIDGILDYLHKYDTPLNWLEIKSLQEELLLLFDNDLDRKNLATKLMVIRKVDENINKFTNFKSIYSFFEYDLCQKKEIFVCSDDLFQKQLYVELHKYVKKKNESIVSEKIKNLQNIIKEIEKRKCGNKYNKLMEQLTERFNFLNSKAVEYKPDKVLNKAIHTPIINSQFFNSNLRVEGTLSQDELDSLLKEYKEKIINSLKGLIKNNKMQCNHAEIDTLYECALDIDCILIKHNLNIEIDLYFDLLFENYNLWKSGHKKNETILRSKIERGKNNEKTK